MCRFIYAHAIGFFAKDPVAADGVALLEADNVSEVAYQRILEGRQPGRARANDTNTRFGRAVWPHWVHSCLFLKCHSGRARCNLL
jgi:hypothetical protein